MIHISTRSYFILDNSVLSSSEGLDKGVVIYDSWYIFLQKQLFRSHCNTSDGSSIIYVFHTYIHIFLRYVELTSDVHRQVIRYYLR